MKYSIQKISLMSFVLIFLGVGSVWAESLSALIFGQSPSTISAADKEAIAKLLGVSVGSDGKSLMQDEFPVQVNTSELDVNSDHIPEILILTSGPQFGMNGSAAVLYIKNAQGKYVMNLGFPAGAVTPLPTKTQGYQDLQIGGPGFECPIWKWNGRDYAFSHKVSCQ